MVEIFQGDIGTKIILNAGQDISSAAVLKIKYKKPDKTTGEWGATLEGTDYAFYITESGDLDVSGTWMLQLYVELPAWKGSGSVARFSVVGKI